MDITKQSQNYLQRLNQIRQKYGCSTIHQYDDLSSKNNIDPHTNRNSVDKILKTQKQIYSQLARIKQLQNIKSTVQNNIKNSKMINYNMFKGNSQYFGLSPSINKQNYYNPQFSQITLRKITRTQTKQYGVQTHDQYSKTIQDQNITNHYEAANNKIHTYAEDKFIQMNRSRRRSQMQINKKKINRSVNNNSEKDNSFRNKESTAQTSINLMNKTINDDKIKAWTTYHDFNINQQSRTFGLTMNDFNPKLQTGYKAILPQGTQKYIHCLDNLSSIQQKIKNVLGQKRH